MIKAVCLLILLPSMCFARGADVPVGGYTKADGTNVQPYMRTAPDGTAANNYSTSGNYNPYTGAYGTKNPNSYSSGYSPYTTYPAPPVVSFQDRMQSWMGHTQKDLMAQLGSPYKTHSQKDNGVSYEYTDLNQRIEFFADRNGLIWKWKFWRYN